jgi:phosphatidylglycerophosphatase A
MLLFILGFLVCTKAEAIFGKKDSGRIVIDEIASMCLVYLFIKPSWGMLILGFIIFRVFDIVKPPPARKVQEFSGSRGVMLDDIIAACYTVAVLFVIYIVKEAGILPAACR